MRVVILAGGKGVRLQPYTSVLPKPLMPIDNYPILEIVLKQLKKSGFDEITISVGHLASLIRAYFGIGEKFGLQIKYSEEEILLGTAGPLSLIKDLDENFLLMNGDLLTDLDYKDMFENHIKNKSIATIAICKRKVPISLGIIELDKNKTVIDYIEKPNLTHYVSMGIYVFKRDILKYINKNKYLNLPDLIKILIEKNEKINSYIFKGKWLDVGRPEDYEEAVEIFTRNHKLFLP
jgi:NDP-sugar pyrophosphorylase family protein